MSYANYFSRPKVVTRRERRETSTSMSCSPEYATRASEGRRNRGVLPSASQVDSHSIGVLHHGHERRSITVRMLLCIYICMFCIDVRQISLHLAGLYPQSPCLSSALQARHESPKSTSKQTHLSRLPLSCNPLPIMSNLEEYYPVSCPFCNAIVAFGMPP